MDPDEHHPEEYISFKEKWSEGIYNLGGYTMVPNLLLVSAAMFEITPAELVILINIESHRWTAARSPYPSIERLAERIGWSRRTVTRHITSLNKKGLVVRRRRGLGKTNEYDITPLIWKLDEVSKYISDNLDELIGQNGHVDNDKTGSTNAPRTSSKLNKYNTDNIKKIINQTLRTKAAQGNYKYSNRPFTGNLDDIDF